MTDTSSKNWSGGSTVWFIVAVEKKLMHPGSREPFCIMPAAGPRVSYTLWTGTFGMSPHKLAGVGDNLPPAKQQALLHGKPSPYPRVYNSRVASRHFQTSDFIESYLNWRKIISTSLPRDRVWGNRADQIFSRLRESNSIYLDAGDPLLREDIRYTLALPSFSTNKDWSAAEVKSERCSSVINTPLPHDRGRVLRSLGAADAFCRTRPWRVGAWRMSAVLSETQGWNHAWWERAAALWEINARGRGCTRRTVEEACVRQQLRKQTAGRW